MRTVRWPALVTPTALMPFLCGLITIPPPHTLCTTPSSLSQLSRCISSLACSRNSSNTNAMAAWAYVHAPLQTSQLGATAVRGYMDQMCASGYTGPLCGACAMQPIAYGHSGFRCIRCLPAGWNTLLYLLVCCVMFAIPAMQMVLHSKNVHKRTLHLAAQGGAAGLGGPMRNPWASSTSGAQAAGAASVGGGPQRGRFPGLHPLQEVASGEEYGSSRVASAAGNKDVGSVQLAELQSSPHDKQQHRSDTTPDKSWPADEAVAVTATEADLGPWGEDVYPNMSVTAPAYGAGPSKPCWPGASRPAQAEHSKDSLRYPSNPLAPSPFAVPGTAAPAAATATTGSGSKEGGPVANRGPLGSQPVASAAAAPVGYYNRCSVAAPTAGSYDLSNKPSSKSGSIRGLLDRLFGVESLSYDMWGVSRHSGGMGMPPQPTAPMPSGTSAPAPAASAAQAAPAAAPAPTAAGPADLAPVASAFARQRTSIMPRFWHDDVLSVSEVASLCLLKPFVAHTCYCVEPVQQHSGTSPMLWRDDRESSVKDVRTAPHWSVTRCRVVHLHHSVHSCCIATAKPRLRIACVIYLIRWCSHPAHATWQVAG